MHGQDGEPELAYEFLRTVWGQGYATEAAQAVLGWATESGYRRLWATT
nr:GNAT family N-acetyltransferase [Glaciibacter superstes]